MTCIAVKDKEEPPAFSSIICLLDSPDIFDAVVAHLDAADCAIVSLACRGLRSRFSCITKISKSPLRRRLSRTRFLDLLSTIARDLPNEYVCIACARLHRVESQDEGHAHDARVIEDVSHEKITQDAAECALVMPCQRRYLPPFSSNNYSRTPRTFLDRFGYTYAACNGSDDGNLYTFTGALKSARRAPLSGLLHRDVQLLLKRARLLRDQTDSNKKPHQYDMNRLDLEKSVKKALETITVARKWESYHGNRRIHGHTLSYTFTPRLVVGNNGNASCGQGHYQSPRFLLKTELVFTMPYVIIMPISICPHQLLNHFDYYEWNTALRGAWRRVAPAAAEPFQSYNVTGEILLTKGIHEPALAGRLRPHEMWLDTMIRCVIAMRDRYRRQAKSDEETLKRLVKDPKLCAQILEEDWDRRRRDSHGFELSGSCHRCPTDIQIHLSDITKKLRILVWQDFGTETSVIDELWQSHLPGLFVQAESGSEPYVQPNTWRSGPSIWHREGSIREAFETAESFL